MDDELEDVMTVLKSLAFTVLLSAAMTRFLRPQDQGNSRLEEQKQLLADTSFVRMTPA